MAWLMVTVLLLANVMIGTYSNCNKHEVSCTTANEESGVCKPFTECINLYVDYDKYIKHTCKLPTGGKGICCPTTIKDADDSNEELPSHIEEYEGPLTGKVPEISQEDIEAARAEAKKHHERRKRIEEELIKSNLTVKKGSMTAFHQLVTYTSNEAMHIAEAIEDLATPALYLIKTHNLITEDVVPGIFELLRGDNEEKKRLSSNDEEPCEESIYRTPDGSCNNLKHRNWGKPLTAFNRIARPDYCDGIQEPRCTHDKSPLKSPRIISYTVLRDLDKPHKRITTFFTTFVQFIDHDIILTPVTRAQGNIGIKCCDPKIQADPQNLRHPDCFEIKVPKDDPDYASFNITCLDFVRSLQAPSYNVIGIRQQMNEMTAAVDGSQIYDSTENMTASLRSKKGGKLIFEICNGDQYLPFSSPDQTCSRPDVSFRAGDVRVNKLPQLTLFQTVFMRLHNKVVEILKELNPHWDDEKLFQEGRKFVGALIQRVLQMEFLPLLLGVKMMKKFDLLPKEKGYSHDYDPSVVLAVINEAAAAGFRLHDIVSGFEAFLDKNGEKTKVPLRYIFGHPTNITKQGNFENLIRGGTNEEIQNFDEFVTKELTNHLFQFERSMGLDLASLDINRGRDHGMRPYHYIRKLCGLSDIKSFDDLHENRMGDTGARIEKVYKSPKDIDLWIGATTEKPMSEAVVGPTFGCLIGELFRNLKLGDRFWYENGGLKNSFSKCQLELIRKMSFARILCDNSHIAEIQPLPFLKADKKFNKIIPCDDHTIPPMDLSCWKENQ